MCVSRLQWELTQACTSNNHERFGENISKQFTLSACEISMSLSLTFTLVTVCKPKHFRNVLPIKNDEKYQTMWNEPYETISSLLFITCSLPLALPGVQANIHQGRMISGLQTDSGTGDMLSPDPQRMVLIAQCWSESTRQAAWGGWEQCGEGQRGKQDTSW